MNTRTLHQITGKSRRTNHLLRFVLPTMALLCASCGGTPSTNRTLTELQRVRSGDIEVALLAPTDALKPTRNYCTLEFRSGTDRHMVDVGMVKVRTTMTMEGQPMDGYVTDVQRVETGRYEVQMVMAMAGAWQIIVEWEGSAGTGATAFSAAVQ